MNMRTLNRRIAALRSRIAGEQEGLTLVELLVALGIMFVSLLALARTATVAFTDTALSRQRVTANQIANQLLEQARGLPYDTLKKGLSSSDLGGDSNIVSCSGTYRYKSCSGEKIINTASLPATSPLVPHTGSLGPPDYTKTYSWKTYVTEATDVPSEGAYRVIALVSWNGAARGGVSTSVESQTLVYSPNGCIDTTTHPYGAPCQPYHYGNGTVGGGSFTTTGSVTGVIFDSFAGSMLDETADVQSEQISRVTGSLGLPTITRVVGGVQTVTGVSVTSFADSDPATSIGPYQLTNAGPQAPGTLTATGGGNTVTLSIAGGDQGSTRSTTSAGGSNACNSQADSRPCGYATAAPSGAITNSLTLANGVGTATLANVGTTGTASTAYGRRYVPSGDGLVRETMSMTLPEMTFGDLPSGVSDPSGWLGYWIRLTGLTATATAESGTSTVAPTVSITSGQIQAWNGAGYTTTTINTSSGTIAPTAVDHTVTIGADTVTVQISGTLTREASTTTETISSGSTRTAATATIGSPILGSFSYKVTRNGVTEADLTISVNAGRAKASTVYEPVPTA